MEKKSGNGHKGWVAVGTDGREVGWGADPGGGGGEVGGWWGYVRGAF